MKNKNYCIRSGVCVLYSGRVEEIRCCINKNKIKVRLTTLTEAKKKMGTRFEVVAVV